MITFLDWDGARAVLDAGGRVRRFGWKDRWLSKWRGLFIIWTVDENGNFGAWHVALTTDFGSAEFAARDWTTADVSEELAAGVTQDATPTIPPIVAPPPLPAPTFPPHLISVLGPAPTIKRG